jgi:hypothetical protein
MSSLNFDDRKRRLHVNFGLDDHFRLLFALAVAVAG